MKTILSLRSLGALISGLAALALCSCDDGGTGGTGGAGSTSQSAASSMSGQTTATSGSASTGGQNLTLSMIDDMEDMDGSILASAGRQGAWYVYNDGTGTQVPPVDPKGMTPFPMTATSPAQGASKFCATTSGMGFTVWGAGFGFDLNNPGGMNPVKSGYDASKYAGIHFFARLGGNGIASVRFNVGDGNTTPEGGKCMSGGAMPNCSDDFGQSLSLTSTWQEFTIKFSDMTQVGWAMQKLPAIDTKTLYSVHFQAATKVNFDIWIDDIAFFN